MISPRTRLAALKERWHQRSRDDTGVTLVELTLASTFMLIVLTLVGVTMSVITNIEGSVTSQYAEYDQALPALAPVQALLRAEVEPAPVNGGVPTPGFSQFGTTSLSFGVQFYADIGTAYNNLTSAGTTAGPAKIVAVEVDQNGNPVTAPSSANPSVTPTKCTAASPCSFQVRRYLPIVNSGISTCPGVGTGPTCQYPTTYKLITNALDVVNSPADNTGGVPNNPIFGYGMLDPAWPQILDTPGTAVPISSAAIYNNQLTALNAAPYSYVTPTQSVTACAAPNASYPTTAIACPLDAVQDISIDLQVAAPGSGTNGNVDNQTVVYRYPPTGVDGSTVNYPYQYTAVVG